MIRYPEHDKIKIHTIESEEGFKFSVQLTSKDLLQNGRHRSKAGTRACHWSLVIPSPCSSIFAIAHSSIPFACFFWKCRLIRYKHQYLGRQPGYTIIFLRESPIDMNQSVHRHNLIHITIFEFLHAL